LHSASETQNPFEEHLTDVLSGTHEDEGFGEIGAWKKIKLKIFGKVYMGNKKRSGWNNSLSFYAFRCLLHGVQFSYPTGYYEKLICPECVSNM
jgi:hypothetical protein